MKRTLTPLIVAAILSGCASEYTVIDRSTIGLSDSSLNAAKSQLPRYELRKPLIDHLALAQEVYQRQLMLLKERRNKTRARRRDLNFLSFGFLGASALSVGAMAIGGAQAEQADPTKYLVAAGTTSLVGLSLGVIFQISSLMQEDTAVVDDKLRRLQDSYQSMRDQIRMLTSKPPVDQNEAANIEAQLGNLIEQFIDHVQQLNVKG